MQRILVLSSLTLAVAAGEVHPLTLQRAAELALSRNPELVLARLDEQTARRQVDVARDPFVPKVFAGSGLAYSSGFPMTVGGQAPSVFEVNGAAALFDRPAERLVAQRREEAAAAAAGAEHQQDRILLRTVELFLEARRLARVATAVGGQIEVLQRVAEAVGQQLEAGRILALEASRARLDVARARQRLQVAMADQDYAEARLASVLGFAPGDRVRAVEEDLPAAVLPASEEEAAAAALAGHPEIRRLESELRARGYALDAVKAERLPRVNLLAKYGLFARFNNYEDFFRRFERHNAQVGLSFEIPLRPGPAQQARISQSEIAIERLRAELDASRSRIDLEARRHFQEIGQAETAVEVARLDLEVAREEVGGLVARLEEGRASLIEVEAARYAENEKWISYFQARHRLDIARYRLLDQTRGLTAAVRQAAKKRN